MRVRDTIGLNASHQRRLTHAMQVVLVGLLFVGLERRSLGVVVNASIGLGVTYLPALLERDYEVPMDAGLTLWITTAVFLHSLGTVGIPGVGRSFYNSIWWWDHLTHTLSSTIVAATGYATARAIGEHTSDIYLPERFMFVFILLFVLAFGVFWEVIEFAVGGLSATLGSGSILTQYGLEDTMLDLLFDALGGVIVALWGTAYLTDVVGAISDRLEGQGA